MEFLEDKNYFYNDNTNKHYKITNIKDAHDVFTYKIQECELKLLTVSVVAIDPEHTKEYKRVEVYEKIPFGRKRQMSMSLFMKLFYNYREYEDPEEYCYSRFTPITITLSDKYCYKDII